MSRRKTIRAAAKKADVIAWSADVEIQAAEGDSQGPPKFSVVAYTGGPMNIRGFDLPVVVDLSGMSFGNSLVANLDHDPSKRVGHVTEKRKADGKLTLGGIASAATPHRDEVVNSAAGGFIWQASIEARPDKLVELESGKTATINGQSITGPAYVARKSTLKGFAFVSHGADDNTTVAIVAEAGTEKGKSMDKKLKEWIEAMGFDPDDLTETQIKNLTADFEGRAGKREPEPKKPNKASSSLEQIMAEKKAERERREKIEAWAADKYERRPQDERLIVALAEEAIDQNWTFEKFRNEFYDHFTPDPTPIPGSSRTRGLTSDVVEAAICMTSSLSGVESKFKEQTLEAARKYFPNGIGLKQLLILGAQSNGYSGSLGGDVTLEVQRAAFGLGSYARGIHASGGFSTLSVPGILSNTANKFLLEGWAAVDSAWSAFSRRRSVRDFKTVTSYRMTGNLEYDKVGPAGEIKHGTISEETYTNKADTYGKMFAITRADIINDDLGALTDVPRDLGQGAAQKLNTVFWTTFLNNSDFFKSANNNVSTGAGSALGSADGAAINAAEVIFVNQTNAAGKPIAIMPRIMLVPPTLANTARRWMGSFGITQGGTSGLGDSNIYQGRYSIVTSPYMENSSFTGYSTAAWYLLAAPSDAAVIEVCFLNGREAPVVETADADFNVLGIQMRGYHDFGVSLHEYRGGVRSAGS